MLLNRKAVGKFLLFFSFGIMFTSVILGYWMHNTLIEGEWLINYSGIGYVPLANWIFAMIAFAIGFISLFYEPTKK